MNKGYVCFVLGGLSDPQGFACVGGGFIASAEVWGGPFVDHETEAQQKRRYRALQQLSDWFNFGKGALPLGWRRATKDEDIRIRSCLLDAIRGVPGVPGGTGSQA